MNGKLLLGLLGAAVVALVIGLVVSLSSDPTRDKPRAKDPDEPAAEPIRPAASQPPAQRLEPRAARPVPLPGFPPIDIEPPAANKVSSHTVATVRQAVNERFNKCGSGMRGKPDAPTGRIVANLHVRVRGGRLRVTNISLDNAKGLPEHYVSCLLRLFADVDTDIPPGQQDGEDILHMPFNVP
jgi:hypothetical protein